MSAGLWQLRIGGPPAAEDLPPEPPPVLAPVISSPTATKTGSATANLGITTDQGNGVMFWVASLTDTAPTAAQIVAGQIHTGANAPASSSAPILAAGAKAIAAFGLAASTTYFFHFAHRNSAMLLSNVVTSSSITTDAAPVIAEGWNMLNMGGGGYVTGIDITDDGTKYIKCDTYGAYRRKPGDTVWTPVIHIASIGQVNPYGAWEIRAAPTLPNRVFMFYSPFGNSVDKLYRSEDYGEHWTVCKAAGVDFQITNGDCNLYPYAHSNEKIAVDPNNPDVVYVGCPANSFPNVGLWRSFDAGSNWAKVSEIPNPLVQPGIAGICFDRYGGTVDVGGQTRTKRIVLGVGNKGMFETNDGGVTWAAISSATTAAAVLPPITTSEANCVICVYIDGANVTGVSSSPSLTWVARANNYAQGFGRFRNEWYAVAPVSQSYTITATMADGGGTCNIMAYSVKGCDVTSEATIFDGAVVTSNLAEPAYAQKTTTAASSMVVAFIAGGSISVVDTGWTAMLFQQFGFLTEYKTGGPGTYEPHAFNGPGDPWTSYWGAILDAFRNGSLDSTAGFVHAAGGGLVNPGPTDVWMGAMDAAGTYWCIDKCTTIWRYWDNGSARVWQRMDGQGGLPLNYQAGIITFAGTICVDPRVGHEGYVVTSGPHQGLWGYQCLNGNDASPTWRGSGGAPSFPSGAPGRVTGDVPWQVNNIPYPACGQFKIDPVDGTHWLAEGNGVLTYPAIGAVHELNYDFAVYSTWPTIVTQGIENMVGQDVCCSPGMPKITLAFADRNIMQLDDPSAQPTGTLGGTQHNCRQLDWCSSNPAFIGATIPDGVVGNPDQSGWSGDFGSSWTEFAVKPPHNGGGSSIAYARPDNIVIVHSDFQKPYYTKNRGATWTQVNNLPTYWYVAQAYYHERTLVADRIDTGGTDGVFYAYAKTGTGASNKGLWMSVDGGVNWTRRSAFTFVRDEQFAFQMRCSPCPSVVPAEASHSDLWACANPGDGLWFSSDRGVNWTRLPETNNTKAIGFGKAKTPGGYATIFFFGTVAGVSGYWRLTDFDGIQGGQTVGTFFNMTPNGNIDLPRTCQLDFMQIVDGDMNVYGRCFVLMNGSTGCYFEPPS